MALVEAGDLIIWFMIAFVGFMATVVCTVFIVWWLKRGQLWPLLLLRIKKKGQLSAKVYPSNEVEILFSDKKKDDSILWDIFDENGKKVDVAPSRIVRTFHTLKNTSIPIHFCPYNKPTNISLTELEKAPLSIGETKLLTKISYAGGYLKGMGIKLPEAKTFDFNKVLIIALFVVGALLVLLLVMNWQVMGYVAPKAAP